jgi:glycosyltransferase involved in cell wall biosynthesis
VTLALDATYSIGDELSGVGVYSRELMSGLARAHPEARFLYCYRPHRFPRSWRELLPGNARRRLLLERFGSGSFLPFGWQRAALFHGLNQRLPAVRLQRTVVTFHDLFVLSGEYSTAAFRARFAAQAREAARADLILTVSAFTKSQVTGLLGVEPGRIRVVHHGIRLLPLAAGRDGTERERVILHVGAIQKRKNIARLVEAFEAIDSSWRLVLAGSNGYGSEEILARIASSTARHRVLVTGYIPTAELARWYARASIFAFPSLDEGFGMPVLEAMAAGLPVVTSNRSALPEVAGDAALLVNPEDTSALTEALRELTNDQKLRSRLATAGRARAAAFSWEKAVSETWDAYQNLLA